MGVDNLRRWKRIALVTDLDWMINVTSLFGWMTPGEFKRFPVAERDHAIAWAAARTPDRTDRRSSARERDDVVARGTTRRSSSEMPAATSSTIGGPAAQVVRAPSRPGPGGRR